MPSDSLIESMGDGEPVRPLRRRLTESISNKKRLLEIGAAVRRYGFASFYDEVYQFKERLRGADPVMAKELEKVSEARRLRLLLEELGPTFIKLGQMVSTRPDLVPEELAAELGQLRDKTPPVPRAEVAAAILRELGKPAEEVFAEFTWEPIACASIGQVHRASLKDGTKVAVKVQRPGIGPIIRADLELLGWFARILKGRVKLAAVQDPEGVVREFRRMLEREIDYTIEARSVERFRKNFKGFEGILIPAIHWEVTSKRVMVMDFVDGLSVDKIDQIKAKGIDPRPLPQIIGKAFVKQIFLDGWFHADPHQGNIFVVDQKTVALLDFGAIGNLDDLSREQIATFYLSLVQGDVKRAARMLVTMSGAEDVETAQLEADLRDFLDFTMLRRENPSFPAGMNQKMVAIAANHGVSLPATFVLLERALGEVEGVCKTMDPEFDLVTIAQDSLIDVLKGTYLKRPQPMDLIEASADYRRLLRDGPRKVVKVLDDMEQGKFRVVLDTGFVSDLRRQAWRMVLSLSVSIVAAALIYVASLDNQSLPIPVLGSRVGVFAIVFLWALILVLIARRD